MDITTILTLTTIIGFALSAATFLIGRQTAAKTSGEKSGSIMAELGYLKRTTDAIDSKMDKISKQYVDLADRVSRLEEKVKIYHHDA